MLNPVSPTLLVTETPAMWSCVPAPAYARWLLRWGVGFTVSLGVAFPAGVWLMFGATLLVGFGVALMVGGWLLVGVLGYAVHRLWRDRATPLVADAERVTLSYGPALLCRLEEVREIAFQEDPSGDDVSYSLVVFLTCGRSIQLPAWFTALSGSEAQAVCQSFGRFAARVRWGEPHEAEAASRMP